MERTDCQRYRIERASGGAPDSSHQQTCPECARWVERAQLWMRLIAELPRESAPDELDQ